ncbi:MAG: hypothetical protein D6731_18930 [Planctomycetota bacterium]|nr:MAG: hypothetical protein D6731_18930 [Planctomycetota bacterium]
MRLRQLRDAFLHEDLYIVGTGPSVDAFPFEFLRDKLCMGLNDAYKLHPAVGPLAFMHHEVYSHTSRDPAAPFHPLFHELKYPIVKGTSKARAETIDWENPHYVFFDWSHDIDAIWTQTKETDVLYYTPEGCSLHGALQVAWILGARNVFVIGCDSRTFGGRHYADYDKNRIRDRETLREGARNYDAYVHGTLVVQEFLRRKGVRVLNLSPIVGYHQVDLQFEVLSGQRSLEEACALLRPQEGTP